MKSYITYFLIVTGFLVLVGFITKTTTPKYIDIPKNWPKPVYDFKNNPLTDTQKDENTRMASLRIKVEHSIGGMKRYRILSDRLRNHLIDLYDDILGVCAGLWNFYLAN